MCWGVYRVRPRDPNDDARFDEDFSDGEMVLTEEALEQAMKTRVGGRVTEKQDGKGKVDTNKATHRTNLAAACNSNFTYGLLGMTAMH